MESFFSMFGKMDTFFCFDKILFITCFIIAGLMYAGIPVKANVLEFIMCFVPFWYLMLRYIVKTDVKETPTPACTQGYKKRARLDNADDVSIQKEITGKNSSECSSTDNSEVLPEVPESPKKNRRRQKKKRNLRKEKYKMDDSSETSSNSDLCSGIYIQPPTTIYSPLDVYQQLGLDDYSLYQRFENYLLTAEELKLNGFPQESSEYPGKVVLRYQKVEKGSIKRRCCRCASTFHIEPNGQYVAAEPCIYHLKKQVPYRTGYPYHGAYPCCNGNYLSKGCVTGLYHVTQESCLDDVEFVKTKKKAQLNKSKAFSVYALDCEMVYTTAGMEVAKVGIVGISGLTLFESFVLPQHAILDYNTQYSGITERDLCNISMTLEDVQAYLLKLLNQDSILVGHGLENDLKVLRLIHKNIIDTSVVFPHQHSKRKMSLKNLAREFLNKEIQQSTSGHNCIEDARTCLELMLYKISEEPQEEPLVVQDENKNSILQNINTTVEYIPRRVPSCNHCGGSIEASYEAPSHSSLTTYGTHVYMNNFYSGYLMPNTHQNYIY